MALRQEEFTSLCDDVDLDRDRALVERCQAGDSGAFGNLYARYYERLLRFCLRRLNDRHEAEDAAQEAFARAWKALPNFAGERRFYPWLTVIAGNICTDMLRRRSRSTPTDDLELSAHQPIGAGGSETSEELVLAAVDGELVNRALGRLSVRHRHVLAMREGSGWTYQQIADHEGVEIGTIETLLWRARQALKREFSVLSESKGALAGFLVGTGALIRRGVLRAANRGAVVQGSGGAGGGLRNAVAGVAVTSAAVAAALITPNALSTPPSSPPAVSATAPDSLANPQLAIPAPPSTTASTVPATTGDGAGFTEANKGAGGGGTSKIAASNSGGKGLQSTSRQALPGGLSVPGSLTNGVAGPALTPVVSGLNNGLTNVTNGVTNAIGGLSAALGLNPILSTLGLLPPQAASTTTTTPGLVPTLTNTLNSTLKALLGQH